MGQGPMRTSGLTVSVVEGEAGINNIRQHTASDVVVRVVDDGQKPVPGAAVVFTLPSQGASGKFRDGGGILTVTTDAEGKAAARGLKPNEVTGKMEIHITASFQGRTGNTVATQFNMDVRKHDGGGNGKLIAILVLVGAAAAGGTIAALHSSNSGSGTTTPSIPTITLSPGTGTVAPPQ
jgi:hypothetical protein